MNSVLLNGVKTYCFNSKEDLITFAASEKKSLIAINAEKILHANDLTRGLINHNIGYADGIGAVWALKKKGFKNAIKIPGCELWLDVINTFYKESSFYFIGATEVTINETIKRLKIDFPGINIVGYRNGYLSNEEEKQQLIEDVSAKKPGVVIVAMGSPKQELLIMQMQERHKALYQGVGGSFDVYIGNVERAPRWWVKHNLEWAYRLVKQPSRIKRQIHLVRFFALLQLNRF